MRTHAFFVPLPIPGTIGSIPNQMFKRITFLAALLLLFSCTKEPMAFIDIIGDSNLTLSSDFDSAVVHFNSSCDWSATVSETWISVFPESGSAGDDITLTIKVRENDPEAGTRDGVITILSKDKKEAITIHQEQKDAIILGQYVYDIPTSGGFISVQINHNVPVSATISDSAKDWITLSSTKSMTSSFLSFVVSKNDEVEPRSGYITITNGTIESTITVNQKQKDDIVIEQSQYTVAACGEEISVNLSSNVNYEVSVLEGCMDWISVVGTKSMNDSMVNLIVSENTTARERQGYVKVSYGDISRLISVTQSAGKLVFDATKVQIAEGSEKKIGVSLETGNLPDEKISWSSSNSSVVSVVDGVVKGLAGGTAVITASVGDLSADCIVEVVLEKDLDLEHKVSLALTGTGMMIVGSQVYYSRTYTITNSSIVDIELVSIATSNSIPLSGRVKAGDSYQKELYFSYNVFPKVTLTFKYKDKQYSISSTM